MRSELFSEFAPHTGANDSVRSELFKHVRITLLLSGIFETKQALVSQQKFVTNTILHGVHSCAVFSLIFSLENSTHLCTIHTRRPFLLWAFFHTGSTHLGHDLETMLLVNNLHVYLDLLHGLVCSMAGYCHTVWVLPYCTLDHATSQNMIIHRVTLF